MDNLGLISLFLFQVYSNSWARSYKTIPPPTSISSRTQQCYCPNVYLTRECQPTRFVRYEFSSLLCCQMNIFNGKAISRNYVSISREHFTAPCLVLFRSTIEYVRQCTCVWLEGDCPILNALLGSHTNVYKGTLRNNIHLRLRTQQSELGKDLSSMCSLSFLLLVSNCGRTFVLLDSLPSYAHFWYLSINIAITWGWNHLWKYHFTHAILSKM